MSRKTPAFACVTVEVLMQTSLVISVVDCFVSPCRENSCFQSAMQRGKTGQFGPFFIFSSTKSSTQQHQNLTGLKSLFFTALSVLWLDRSGKGCIEEKQVRLWQELGDGLYMQPLFCCSSFLVQTLMLFINCGSERSDLTCCFHNRRRAERHSYLGSD